MERAICEFRLRVPGCGVCDGTVHTGLPVATQGNNSSRPWLWPGLPGCICQAVSINLRQATGPQGPRAIQIPAPAVHEGYPAQVASPHCPRDRGAEAIAQYAACFSGAACRLCLRCSEARQPGLTPCKHSASRDNIQASSSQNRRVAATCATLPNHTHRRDRLRHISNECYPHPPRSAELSNHKDHAHAGSAIRSFAAPLGGAKAPPPPPLPARHGPATCHPPQSNDSNHCLSAAPRASQLPPRRHRLKRDALGGRH